MIQFYFLAISVLFIATSCSTFQYATVSSVLSKNNSDKFIYENDTIRVKYGFAGENCPIHIEVFNKLDRPVFIDWRKSALITNEERFAYWKDEASLDASSTSSEIRWTNYFSTSTGTIQGIVSKNEQVSFIPPQSMISVSPLVVRTSLFELPKPTPEQEIQVNNFNQKGARYLYEPEHSPLQFRSFLTLSLTDDFKNPIYFDHRFWVSDLIQSTGAAPMVPDKSPDNRFYIKGSDNLQAGATVVLCIPVILAMAFLGSQ